MPRTIVDLPAAQLRDLDSRCRSLRISRAEGVRRAIRVFLSESSGDSERGFGLWKPTASKPRRPQTENDV